MKKKFVITLIVPIITILSTVFYVMFIACPVGYDDNSRWTIGKLVDRNKLPSNLVHYEFVAYIGKQKYVVNTSGILNYEVGKYYYLYYNKEFPCCIRAVERSSTEPIAVKDSIVEAFIDRNGITNFDDNDGFNVGIFNLLFGKIKTQFANCECTPASARRSVPQ